MLREFGSDGRCGPRSATDADGPVELTEPLGVELADNTQDTTAEQTPVATGNSWLGRSEDLSQATERRSGIDVERMNDSSVQDINIDGSHAPHHIPAS
jgi:hypothetical protein